MSHCHCHESQNRLRSGIAVAVVEAGNCSSDWTPSLGISICLRYGPKKQSKNKKTKQKNSFIKKTSKYKTKQKNLMYLLCARYNVSSLDILLESNSLCPQRAYSIVVKTVFWWVVVAVVVLKNKKCKNSQYTSMTKLFPLELAS